MMKKIFLLILITITMHTMTNGQQNPQQPLLRHVVMFGWKDADTNQINKVVAAFKALPSKISLIKSFEWGTNNSPEGLNQGLTHCFLVTFSSEADRDAYLIHPAHKEFVSLLKPAPDKVTVLDYWVK